MKDSNWWVDIFGLSCNKKRPNEKVRAIGKIDNIIRVDYNQRARRGKVADKNKKTLIFEIVNNKAKKKIKIIPMAIWLMHMLKLVSCNNLVI